MYQTQEDSEQPTEEATEDTVATEVTVETTAIEEAEAEEVVIPLLPILVNPINSSNLGKEEPKTMADIEEINLQGEESSPPRTTASMTSSPTSRETEAGEW